MLTKPSRCIAGVLIIWSAVFASAAVPQDIPKPADDGKEVKEGKGKWVPVFQRHASDYAITSGPGEEAKRLPEPLLRWWQPIRGGDDGALYLWVRNGRPVAAVTFFTFKWPNGERVIVHERHSFISGPLESTWRGQTPWKTSKPGLTFKPVPDAPRPAETAQGRLRQMQAMVRDVSATTTDDRSSTWTMRPLSKPLYRYELPEQDPNDGALFALAQGTDPEAFFVVETRGSGQDAHWEYAVARFTDLALRVDYKGREVFKGPNTLGSRSDIYFCNTVLSKPSDSPEDFR
jgi:hypothetical protein